MYEWSIGKLDKYNLISAISNVLIYIPTYVPKYIYIYYIVFKYVFEKYLIQKRGFI